jgi:hypothetical protein
MLVELATDQVTDAADQAVSDYRNFHAWLQPVFLERLQAQFAAEDDRAVAEHYCEQLGTSAPGWDPDEDETTAEDATTPAGRYIARFHPQAWVNGSAMSVDPEGPVCWDCTAHVEALDADSFARTLRPDSHASDVLRMLENAPRWVQRWQGPYWIELEERHEKAIETPLAATG